MVTIWKITPGEDGSLWDECIENKCIAIGWNYEDGFRKYNSLEDVKQDYSRNDANSIWYFYKKIELNDIIIANRGLDNILGVGVVKSEYIDPKDKQNPNLRFKNVRLVDWVIIEELEKIYNKFDTKTVTPQNSNKAIERWNEIKNGYIKKNLKYKDILQEIFSINDENGQYNGDDGMKNEKQMIDLISQLIKSKGFTFSRQRITNYYLSLKTKPFVILTGISGTGKTKITELFAEAVCTDSEKQYLLLPVRPDWNDDKYLLGYYNPLTKLYQSTQFLDLIIKASNDLENPYFICLDEMNLARVEYYFSTFLSALESKSKEILLHSSDNEVKTEDGKEIPSKIPIPNNLFFTGTVNMDETTYRFSPKVLDRANTIEFNDIDLLQSREDETSTPTNSDLPASFNKYFLNDEVRMNGITSDAYSKWETEKWGEFVGILDTINKEALEEHNLHFGYRIRDEIMRYLYFAQELYGDGFTENTAIDFQIKQKVLPKIKGPESIRPALESMEKLAEKYPYTSFKIKQMLEALSNGYTDFYQ